MTNYVPAVEDSEAMTEIHSRMHALISRAIPMNFHDENNLNDLLIPGQDEAYQCGRKRGAQECNAELLAALQGFLDMYVPAANSGDWGYWNPEEDPEVIAARAAIAKATGA